MVLSGDYTLKDVINFDVHPTTLTINKNNGNILSSVGSLASITFDTANDEIIYTSIDEITTTIVYTNGAWVDADYKIIEFLNVEIPTLSNNLILFYENIEPTNGLPLLAYQNTGDNKYVDKTYIISLKSVIFGWFRDSIDIREFDMNIESTDVIEFNYVYIPSLKRYYYVTRFTMHSTNIVVLHLKCDVLMSFKDDILSSRGFIERTEDSSYYNKYIVDNFATRKTTESIEIVNITKGTTGNYIDSQSSTKWTSNSELTPYLLSVVRK